MTMTQSVPEPNHFADIDAAIIDLDGTLVDTLGDFDVALNMALAELGLPPIGREAIRERVGKGSEHLVGSVLDHIGAARAQHFDAAWALYQKHYGAINGQHAKLYDGVREGLDRFRARGWTLACLTNKPLGFAEALLKHQQLDGYFQFVFGGDSFARRKPDPLPLLETCKALGTDPTRTLMVGDSSNDAKAARAAGCPVWLVSYGYNHGEPIDAVDADGVVDSIAEIG